MEDPLDRFVDRKYLPEWLVVGGILLLVISAFVWWTQVYENPYNVYWGMLDSSLQVSSVTKHITQNSQGANLDQYITLEFGANNLAHGKTILKNATSTVTTESIGTLGSNYVRYTDIRSSQKDPQGKSLQFGAVLGKWAKSPVANTAAQTASTPFLVQAMIGLSGGNLVPMGNLSAAERQNLVRQLHQNAIFNTAFGNVKKQKANGKTVYVYAVAIEPVAYVAFEKNFAADTGVKSLQNILEPKMPSALGACTISLPPSRSTR